MLGRSNVATRRKAKGMITEALHGASLSEKERANGQFPSAYGEGRLIVTDKIRNPQCSGTPEDVIGFTLRRAKKRRKCEERRDPRTAILRCPELSACKSLNRLGGWHG